ncbi:MAG TPA: hypothetical protein PLF40_26425 [Kofleriaceae bacterium]|nr:hypothetical protein [Kofleriaceae bacterium]
MSDPTRWIEDDNVDDFTKQLLTAGRSEQLPSKRAAAIAAGLGTSVASSAASAGAVWTVGKIVLLLTTVGTIGVGGYMWSQRSPAPTMQPATQPAQVRAPAPPAEHAPAPAPALALAPAPAPPAELVAPAPVPPAALAPATAPPAHTLSPRPTKAATPAPTPHATLPPPDPTNDLAAEVALLDRANRGLNSHDVAAAVAAMSEYRTQFQHGALAAAAAAVEFEIARQSGNHADAIARGTEFLRRYPSSPLRKRIEARLHELQPQESP